MLDKYEVAQILREMAVLIQLADKNPTKSLAYRRAANTIETISDLPKTVKEKELTQFPGIGKEISKTVTVLVEYGHFPYLEKLKQSLPESLLELTLIPGLTIKRIRSLYENYQIGSLEELERLFRDNSKKLKGFGKEFKLKILNRIQYYKTHGSFLLYPKAAAIAEAFIEKFNRYGISVEITGEIRRKLELISVINLIAITESPEMCLSLFSKHTFVQKILQQNESEVWMLLKQGVKAHLQTAPREFVPSLQLYQTGNTKHLNELKQEAKVKNFELIKISRSVKSEQEIYSALNLPFIPPEVREGYGEIEAAKHGNTFNLIEEKDLRGTFHCHTTDSDGNNTIEEMAEAAKQLGWQYIGISDHSKSSYQAQGMQEEQLLQQNERIKGLNKQFGPFFHVFSGIECDILKDGTLDFSDDVLKKLDFVIASIHRRYNLNKIEMTKRMIKAIENPYVTMVGHLTGRLLKNREPYQLDIHKVIEACISNGKIIEINAYPDRLDLDWRYWIHAREKGLKCSINPDAHSVHDLSYCKYGINIARKGWLEKKDAINTLPLADIKAYLKTQS